MSESTVSGGRWTRRVREKSRPIFALLFTVGLAVLIAVYAPQTERFNQLFHWAIAAMGASLACVLGVRSWFGRSRQD